jgi:CBS domain-containing protein
VAAQQCRGGMLRAAAGVLGKRTAAAEQKGCVDMSTSPAAAAPEAGSERILHLSELVGRPITDKRSESIGRLADVIVRLRGAEHPLVIGLVAAVGGREVFVPLEQASSFDGEALRLTSAVLDLRQFERRHGEVLLRADVLGHRLIDVASAHLIKAVDLELRRQGGEWVLAGVDTHRKPRGLLKLLSPSETGVHVFEEWANFEPLIGHASSALLRGPFGRIRRLKPAQIADLLEEASKAEETEILGQVHADPELEADVFEELDEDLATRLLGARTDAEIAEVLSRMRADDAADAISELPQRRRQPVLDLMPVGQRTKVLTLMGYNPTSAGGLMGMDFLTVPQDVAVLQALAAVSGADSLQPEALTSVHALDGHGRLSGVVKVVTLLQADPAARLSDVFDDDPVRIGADTDVVDVAVLMSDYNLITIPVVDRNRVMIGLITVDDVLEVTLPDDWRRREAAEPPDSRRGKKP